MWQHWIVTTGGYVSLTSECCLTLRTAGVSKTIWGWASPCGCHKTQSARAVLNEHRSWNNRGRAGSLLTLVSQQSLAGGKKLTAENLDVKPPCRTTYNLRPSFNLSPDSRSTAGLIGNDPVQASGSSNFSFPELLSSKNLKPRPQLRQMGTARKSTKYQLAQIPKVSSTSLDSTEVAKEFTYVLSERGGGNVNESHRLCPRRPLAW